MRTARIVAASFWAAVLLAGLGMAAQDDKDYAKDLREAQALQQRKQYKDCVQRCDKMLGLYKEPRQVKELARLKADNLVLDNQPDEALKTLADLAKTFAEDKELQTAVALRTGDLERTLKKLDEAVAAYRKAAETAPKEPPGPAAEALVRAADVLVEMKKWPEARAECWRVICSYPIEPTSCQAAQAKIVETYRAESQWAEALGAARILYDAAGTEQAIRDAAQVLAQAFLAADGNLARANEFLAYQSFGPDGPDGKPNTPDDIPVNRLAEVKYPTPSAAANQGFQAALGAQPETYEGYRAKAFLYIYWGKPKEGAAQFRVAFKAANLTQLPAASQELVLVGMKAHTASFRGLDRIFEFLLYGPKGKSGKENLPDPFAGL